MFGNNSLRNFIPKLFSRLHNLLMPMHLIHSMNKKPISAHTEEIWIKPRGKKQIYAHLHAPTGEELLPAVILVPGAISCGTDYDKGGEMQPHTLAALGFIVLHYDPSGRGKTGGTENYWGKQQQDELTDILLWFQNHPRVQKTNIGIVSFSIGITIAAGTMARHREQLSFVRYLYDWEGPSNRFNITKNDTHPPLLQFPTANNDFWNEREACKFIGDIQCGYFRYQGQTDHMQENNKDHALELMHLASTGKAAWTKLNDNPLNKTYTSPVEDACWVAAENDNKAQILRFLLIASEVDK